MKESKDLKNAKAEKWIADSDIIFTAISTGSFVDYKEAEKAVLQLYVPDMNFDRAGISHALKRLQKYYETKKKYTEVKVETLNKMAADIQECVFTVNGWNNFCRVFELPLNFSNRFCHGGGVPTNFQMVDWFEPVSGIDKPTVTKDKWLELFGSFDDVETITSIRELKENLISFLQKKTYIKTGRKYLVICDFGATFMFRGEKKLTERKHPIQRFA